jgi:rod shape-determining protein MreC
VRLVAYGKGRSDQLALANIPLSSDVKVGDAIVTSGLGGRFPAGFPVGTVTALQPDDSRAFLVGDLAPAAQLDRGRDVLLLRQQAASAAPVAADARSRPAEPVGSDPRPTPQQPVPAAETRR